MPRSQADLTALKAELTNDPNGLGLTLTATVEEDNANAARLNAVVVGQTILRERITHEELSGVIVDSDFGTLSTGQQEYFMYMRAESYDTSSGSEFRAALEDAYPSNSDTYPRLNPLLNPDGNRINQMYQAGLLEVGGTVTASDISQARQLP